ncbi:hypothetical protein CDL12_28202 [Handroanthus impetiginosus]|uniref:Uncharacterized protein n=1 Tax=Handroanthus impetiginosus TaxID=429701 RepID=A0A2G9G1W7_9LAMI|nr:hypothetical protein CDL12_28202 [Handroanthus impetiginosus]
MLDDEINHRSESKVLVGQKRTIGDVEETSDNSQKRVKMRDLQSFFRWEGQVGIEGSKSAHPDVNSDSRTLGLNANCVVSDDAPCIDESSKPPTKEEVQHNDGITKARGLDLDLNAEDISSSVNDPFHPYNKCEPLKSRDESECGCSVGPLDEKEPMRVWNGLKENNFMSTRFEAVPTSIPKPRGRKKNNNEVMKKRIELAKKEQVDRFARVAAPSGLLNGLNPGIINHVRNSKQVFSIIENIVKSERSRNKLSGSKKSNQIKNGAQELAEKKEVEKNYDLCSKSVYPDAEVIRCGDDASMGQRKMFSAMPPPCNIATEDDILALKLSSSATVVSENTSCLSNDESGNFSSVTSLSVKAANVASQWLELLSQDIKGRLAALRRSKKRVRAVITTELPFLVTREFSSNLEKDTFMTNGSTGCHLNLATANVHSVRWNAIFAQMDKALSEEESHLESWLNQVKEMQLHCEKGLYRNSSYHAQHQIGSVGNDNRLGAADNTEKDLAVRAAAASIYSTCNFLLSMENPTCC